jgi:hypothetical protein
MHVGDEKRPYPANFARLFRQTVGPKLAPARRRAPEIPVDRIGSRSKKKQRTGSLHQRPTLAPPKRSASVADTVAASAPSLGGLPI